MSKKLIRRDGAMIPGGFPFVDARTNQRFDGFEAGGFGDQVHKIIRHRLGNPNIYPPSEAKWFSFEAVANELDEYQCLRMAGDSRFCSDPNSEHAQQAAAHAAGVCRFCGGQLKERLCPTCSGHRVIGYTCLKCGSTL